MTPRHLSRQVLALESLKDAYRQRVNLALEIFGQGLWQNPNLQPSCFVLADATVWLKAAECTLGRWAWLNRLAQGEDDASLSARGELAREALTRCTREVESRLRRFDEELPHLRRGYYPPEIRAASLLFQQSVGAEQDLLTSQTAKAVGVPYAGDPEALGRLPGLLAPGTRPPAAGSGVE